jgi:RNA-directed DNA polymerase
MISSFSEFADFLGIEEKKLGWLVNEKSDELKYRHFTVKKKTGGKRLISTPNPILKQSQRKIAELLSDHYRPKKYVCGFLEGKSIKTNASFHQNKRWLVNLDLKDFFPSIGPERVCFLLKGIWGNDKENLFSPEVAYYITKLCTFEGGLPQGAPTSPILSNITSGKLDRELDEYSRKEGIHYSRYADDLSFSPFHRKVKAESIVINGDIIEVAPAVVSIIEKNRFQINKKKIRCFTKKNRQVVTGIVVNDFSNVPRKIIRNIRSMLWNWENTHLTDCQQVFDEKQAEEIEIQKLFEWHLAGKISYLSMIRGRGDKFFLQFREKFISLLDRDLEGGQEAVGLKNFLRLNKHDLKNIPKRPVSSFTLLKDDFENRSQSLSSLLQTHLGSWALSRIKVDIEIESLISRYRTDEIMESLLIAEAEFISFTNKRSNENSTEAKYMEFFNTLVRLNGLYCSELLNIKERESKLKLIDFPTFYSREFKFFKPRGRINPELLNLEKLKSFDKPERLKSPGPSIWLWMALQEIDNEGDRDVMRVQEAYSQVREKNKNFLNDPLNILSKLRNHTLSEKVPIKELRKKILLVWSVFGGGNIFSEDNFSNT